MPPRQIQARPDQPVFRTELDTRLRLLWRAVVAQLASPPAETMGVELAALRAEIGALRLEVADLRRHLDGARRQISSLVEVVRR